METKVAQVAAERIVLSHSSRETVLEFCYRMSLGQVQQAMRLLLRFRKDLAGKFAELIPGGNTELHG